MYVGLKADIASILPTGTHLNLKRNIFYAPRISVLRTFIMCEYLENLESYTMATVHIATIAIVLERFSECAVALHLMISFNKFTKPIKKRILLVRDPRTYSQVFDCRNY